MSFTRQGPLDLVKAAVVSCLGLGYSPFASGTAGTLGAVGIVLSLHSVKDASWFHFGWAMVILAVVGLVVGVPLGNWAERYYGRKDPGHVVLDELVGYFVCLFRIRGGFPGVTELTVAFFAFRLFDVVKPPPARRLEHLPGGYGVMLDDVIAGIYAGMLVSVLREWLRWP